MMPKKPRKKKKEKSRIALMYELKRVTWNCSYCDASNVSNVAFSRTGKECMGCGKTNSLIWTSDN